MGTDTSGVDWSVIEDFSHYIEEYTDKNNINLVVFDDEVKDVLNFSHERLLSLNGEQLSAYAFKLNAYAFYMQHELNANQAKLNWCEDCVHFLMAKCYDPELIVKHEIRRQMVIVNNDFAYKVERVRSKLNVRVAMLQGVVQDVRSMAHNLIDMSRKRF